MSPFGEIETSKMAAYIADNFEKCYNFSTSLHRKMILVSRYRLLGTRNPMEEETLRFENSFFQINPILRIIWKSAITFQLVHLGR